MIKKLIIHSILIPLLIALTIVLMTKYQNDDTNINEVADDVVITRESDQDNRKYYEVANPGIRVEGSKVYLDSDPSLSVDLDLEEKAQVLSVAYSYDNKYVAVVTSDGADESFINKLQIIEVGSGEVQSQIISGDEYSLSSDESGTIGSIFSVRFMNDSYKLYYSESYGGPGVANFVYDWGNDNEYNISELTFGEIIYVLPPSDQIISDEYKEFENDLLIVNTTTYAVGGRYWFVDLYDLTTDQIVKHNVIPNEVWGLEVFISMYITG